MCLPSLSSILHRTTDKHAATVPIVPKEGSSLCDQIEKIAGIAGALSKAMGEAKTNGTRWACSGLTLAAGLNNLRNGNVFSGLSMTTAGGAELIKLIRGYRDYPQLTGLLENAGAGTKMIRVLEEANKKTDRQIKLHLSSVEKGLGQIENSREKLVKLALETDGSLQPRIEEANQLFEETGDIFARAQETFERSKYEIGIADMAFVKAMEGLETLIKLANSPITEESPRIFADQSKHLYGLCTVGRQALEKAVSTIEEGQQLLDQAHCKQNEAHEAMGAVIETARIGLQAIALEAKNNELVKQCQTNLKDAQKHQKVAEARRHEQAQILDDIEQMQRDASAEGKGFGLASVMCGLGATAAVTPVALGGGVAAGGIALAGAPVAAAAIGAAAVAAPIVAGASVVYVVHHRHAISDKLHDLIFGKAPVKTGTDYFAISEETQAVRFAFDKKSSGIFGKWLGKPEDNQATRESRTKGHLLIDLGDGQQVAYQANLGEKEPLNWADWMDLRERLLTRLSARSNPMSPAECQKILNALEKGTIERGSKHRPRQGLVKKDFHLFGEVRRAIA